MVVCDSQFLRQSHLLYPSAASHVGITSFTARRHSFESVAILSLGCIFDFINRCS